MQLNKIENIFFTLLWAECGVEYLKNNEKDNII